MSFVKKEGVTLALLFSAFALHLYASSPSVWTGLLLVVGLCHVGALIMVASVDRI